MSNHSTDENESTAMDMPSQISWNLNQPEDQYRGIAVQPASGGDALELGGSAIAKDAAFSLSSDISGGAIDIFGGSGLAAPAPSAYKPPTQPLIEVQVLEQEEPQPAESKADESATAPQYDGSFQAHHAHHSATHNPDEMREAVISILGAMEGAGTIDFYERSSFEFAGRAFSKHADCEFALNIFSDSSSECVVELRRSCGECFEYASVESAVLRELMARGAIQDDADSDAEDESDCEAFGLGFGALPPLDSMELDSGSDAESKVAMDEAAATRILRDAVDLASTRNVLRADIAQLSERMETHMDTLKRVPDIVATIAGVLDAELFDCWAIKMYLDMLHKLIANGTATPPTLCASIGALQKRWRHTVVNEVAPGVCFEFYPSQQIIRSCGAVLQLLTVSPV